MRKRTVKFILESVIIVVICLTPLFLYALQLMSSKDLAYGETDGQSVTSLTFIGADSVDSRYNLDIMSLYCVPRDFSFSLSYVGVDTSLNISIDTYSDSYACVVVVLRDLNNNIYLVDDEIISNFFINDYFVFSLFDYVGSYYPSNQVFIFSYTILVGELPLFSIFNLSSVVLDGQPVYTLEAFMTDFCDIVYLDQSNVFYYTFDYFFGENSTLGLNVLSAGSLLYIAYVCTVYLAWLIFDFILFIPKLCRKWLCKLTQSE